MTDKSSWLRIFTGFVFTVLLAGAAFGQGSGFNFQGRLNDGATPANGRYDLQFRLYDAVVGGNQVGSLLARPNTVLINGVFSVTIDFGPTAFNSPNNVFVEISVRPGGSPNAFTILGPRQQLTVAPIALRAISTTNADFATNALNAGNSNQLGGLPASEYVTRTSGGADFIRNATTVQPNSNFNISGAGTINGNLNVAGNTIINGNNTIGGNALQSRDKAGYVKAIVYANADGTIRRCFNGMTGASTGNCGFTVQKVSTGVYQVGFGFQVTDRYASVTQAKSSGQVNIVPSISEFDNPSLPNTLFVYTNITDVDYAQSFADNSFVLFVY
jgi:hypothetical protein